MQAEFPSAATMQRHSPHCAAQAIPSRDRTTLRDWAVGAAHIAVACLAAILRLAWQMVRLPLLTFLVIFEPIVSFLLKTLALLIATTALFWKFADSKPDFPLWTIVAASLACVLLLALYHALIRILYGSTPRI